MFKKVLAVLFVAVTFTGCAALQTVSEKYVPEVTALLGTQGIAIEVDPKFGFSKFCLDPVGTAVNVLSNIPVVGQFVTGFVGICETE